MTMNTAHTSVPTPSERLVLISSSGGRSSISLPQLGVPSALERTVPSNCTWGKGQAMSLDGGRTLRKRTDQRSTVSTCLNEAVALLSC